MLETLGLGWKMLVLIELWEGRDTKRKQMGNYSVYKEKEEDG